MAGVVGVLGVALWYALARVAPGPAVRRMVAGLGSKNEDTSTAAYMLLVKLGPRACSHLLDEAQRGPHTASVLRVLGDLGDPGLIAPLEGFAKSDDSAISAAARESLEALRGQGRGSGSDG